MKPDWRDPSMSVQRDYKLRDGTKVESVTPEYEQGFRTYLLETNPGNLPSWRDDPTYNLKRKK